MDQNRFEVQMTKQIEEEFLDYFKYLKDPRSTRNRLYSILEILLVTMSAAIVTIEAM